MPYFTWVGVDITGATKRGKKAAQSHQDLSAQLICQGVALLHAKPTYASSFLWPITAKTKSNLFKQKAKLLRAGILLPHVLEVIVQQVNNPMIYDVFLSIKHDVEHGISFDKALEKHSELCDPIIVIMLAAGHESGNIINAIENVALYFHNQYIFNKNLRAALAMPLLTLLFFVGISSFIFVCIIPRFTDMLSSLQQDLPALTKSMIFISEFISSYSMLYLVIVIAISIFCMYRYLITSQGKKLWSSILNSIPFVGTIIWRHHMCQILQALSLLITSGVPLVSALKIVSESIDNEETAMQLKSLHLDVASGRLLSYAMGTTSLFFPEIIALIHVGEESGTLGHSLEASALVYNDKVEESLRRFIFFLQPCVIILLGLLVTILIFAVYSPIMQLSHVI